MTTPGTTLCVISGSERDGVANNTAFIHLRAMKKGDDALIYHTGGERSAVGIAKIVSNPYPDPKEEDDRLVVVDLKPTRKLARPVSLDEIRPTKRSPAGTCCTSAGSASFLSPIRCGIDFSNFPTPPRKHDADTPAC